MLISKRILWIALLCFVIAQSQAQKAAPRWTEQKANEWYAKQGWLRGCNYQPATAINQLEMFQPETFDTATINKELGWAEGLGLNVILYTCIIYYGQPIRKGLRKGSTPIYV